MTARTRHQLGAVHERITANLRALRKQRGWSVVHLAELCANAGMPSLTRASLVNMERRPDGLSARMARRVSVDELVFLAELFDVRPSELIDAPLWVPCAECNGTGRVPTTTEAVA